MLKQILNMININGGSKGAFQDFSDVAERYIASIIAVVIHAFHASNMLINYHYYYYYYGFSPHIQIAPQPAIFIYTVHTYFMCPLQLPIIA